MELERERAYKLILDMILQGDIGSDVPLSARKLADRLKVSRTPVREALSRMSNEGIVEVRMAKGVFLKSVSKNDLKEIYEVRQTLESMAAYFSAQKGATESLLSFGSRFERIINHPTDIDLISIDDIGADFHMEVIAAAKNETLLEMIKPLRIRNTLTFGFPSSQGIDEVLDSVVEHKFILEAIKENDCERARKLMHDHLIRGLNLRLCHFDCDDMALV